MTARKASHSGNSKVVTASPTVGAEEAIAWLKAHGSKKIRDEMGPRYGNHSDKAFGVGMATMQKLAKQLGQNHELALELWNTGWYEARTVAAFVDEPERVTSAQMDRWCRDFDNWGICDTVCFKLFDRTPHAFGKVEKWAERREEFVKRAAFALLASLALHDKSAADAKFLRCLPLVEPSASDERNFVKKGVSWALRSIGRRNPELHAASIEVAQRLVASQDAAARWVGKDALKDLMRGAVVKQLQAQNSRASAGR
jgi:3-methyladenine DNA glycosylase AlkD